MLAVEVMIKRHNIKSETVADIITRRFILQSHRCVSLVGEISSNHSGVIV